MLHPGGAGGVDGAGADLLLAPALSGPEVGHQEGPAGSVVEGLQARWLEQVAFTTSTPRAVSAFAASLDGCDLPP